MPYRRIHRDDTEALVALLTGNDWPYHSHGRPDPATARRWVESGRYDASFWIGDRAGIIGVDELGPDNPLLDIRLGEAARGRGLGTAAVTWLVSHVFSRYPDVRRVEATTRQDNAAMRHVLGKCGFAKEAHYRDAWPAPNGQIHDSVGYAILRHDWTSGTVTKVPWDS